VEGFFFTDDRIFFLKFLGFIDERCVLILPSLPETSSKTRFVKYYIVKRTRNKGASFIPPGLELAAASVTHGSWISV